MSKESNISSGLGTFIFDKALSKKNLLVLLLGLKGAGKSTFLSAVKVGEPVQTNLTAGYIVESFDYKNVKFVVWDVEGPDSFRVLWKHYYQNADALVFVVDSNDRDQIDVASEELKSILDEEEMKNGYLLVLANKQDITGAMPPDEITLRMRLSERKGKQWLIQGTSVQTGQGFKEGFDWLFYLLRHSR